jgi:tRNA-modifying protein YgfZ
VFAVDRSERGKLAITGPEAKPFLQGLVSNDVESLTPGHGCYAAVLTQKGKMIGDLRILDTGEELLLDCERVALQDIFNVLWRGRVGMDVEIHKRTLQMGLLSVVDVSLGGPDEHDNVRTTVAGRPVVAVTTDLGSDLFCWADDLEAVRAEFPPGDEAQLEVLRVEAGRPRYGIDLDDSVIPQEAGLNERAVSFTKGCYVGQETVARLHYRGKPNRHLRGLQLSAPAQPGAEIRLGEKVVGRLGSVVESPRHGPIALALVRREAAPGDVVTVDGQSPAKLIHLPFQAG